MFVHPEDERCLGRRLYDARKELRKSPLCAASWRAYSRYKDYYKEYAARPSNISSVKNKEIYDPVLSFQLPTTFILKNHEGLYSGDKHRALAGFFVEWIIIYYEPKPKLIGAQNLYPVQMVQWQRKRLFNSFDDFIQQSEFL